MFSIESGKNKENSAKSKIIEKSMSQIELISRKKKNCVDKMGFGIFPERSVYFVEVNSIKKKGTRVFVKKISS